MKCVYKLHSFIYIMITFNSVYFCADVKSIYYLKYTQNIQGVPKKFAPED